MVDAHRSVVVSSESRDQLKLTSRTRAVAVNFTDVHRSIQGYSMQSAEGNEEYGDNKNVTERTVAPPSDIPSSVRSTRPFHHCVH